MDRVDIYKLTSQHRLRTFSLPNLYCLLFVCIEGGQIVKKANIHPPKLGIHKGTVYSFYKDTLTALENRGENHWVNHNGIEVEIKMKGHFVIVTSLKKKAEAVHPVQTQNVI